MCAQDKTEGDRPLVSPAQYSGEKNFADALSAPECTLEENMKFVKWEVPENIEVDERMYNK